MTAKRFITLEGGEGAGKSTCLAFIRDFLAQRGQPLVVADHVEVKAIRLPVPGLVEA